MFESVNIYSSVAVYVQIENEVRFAIASGRLKASDQLLSVRELSENLEVNPNTVAKAYRDLEVMGLVYTRRGMGVYINKGVQAQCRKDCQAILAQRAFEISQEAKSSGMSKKEFSDLIAKCWAQEGTPYGDVPKSVLDAVK